MTNIQSVDDIEIIKHINTKEYRLDIRTSKHQERVADYAKMMSKHFGFSPHFSLYLITAAENHDLGKIYFTEEIINGKEGLSPEEWDLIRQHPSKGAEILEKCEPNINVTILDIIRYHHERYDGDGYPDGLREKSIPFGARILGVVDSFDAMANNRPYRKTKYTVESALSELQGLKGKQYDPDIVDKFSAVVLSNFNKVAASYDHSNNISK